MSRFDCNEREWIDGKPYCPYYDYAVMPCEEVEICPGGYDNEIDDEIDEYYEEYEDEYEYDCESENKELDTDKNKK